ncbi:MAG: UxaA family hydrolase [Methanomassiliicoccales archaeon]
MNAKAIKIDEKDNVATAIAEIKKGEIVIVKGKVEEQIKVIQDIPFGHKFATSLIEKGANVVKYGEVIGKATSMIQVGEHVHVHNIESLRGRGDLVRGVLEG